MNQEQLISEGWTPTMQERSLSLEGRQVKCLIASEGHEWMRSYYDRQPAAVRERLAASRFNICPACLKEEVRRLKGEHTVALYFKVIDAIER